MKATPEGVRKVADHQPDADADTDAERKAITDLCTAWGFWQREANRMTPQGGRVKAGQTGPGATYTQLIQLHDAIQRQPPAIDRSVFELYHLHDVRNIKAEAERMGISRPHFYRLLRAFEARVYRMARSIADCRQVEPAWSKK